MELCVVGMLTLYSVARNWDVTPVPVMSNDRNWPNSRPHSTLRSENVSFRLTPALSAQRFSSSVIAGSSESRINK
jgi:hypothetical protein